MRCGASPRIRACRWRPTSSSRLLREAIIAFDPAAKGVIGRLGHYPDGENRFGIHPYMLYKNTRELLRIDRCALGQVKSPTYYRCFVAPERLTHAD